MKRLSESQRIWNIRHSKREEKRKLRRKNKKWQRDRGVGAYEEVLLDVPEEFNLGDNVKDSLDFFDRLRQSILVDRKRGKIDFRTCNSISAGAGFVLAAEVDRCRRLRYRDGRPALTGTYPSDEGMGRFLDDLGFFRCLKIQSPHMNVTIPRRPDSSPCVRVAAIGARKCTMSPRCWAPAR